MAPNVAAHFWADRCASTQGIQSPNGMNSWRQQPGELKHLFSCRGILKQSKARHTGAAGTGRVIALEEIFFFCLFFFCKIFSEEYGFEEHNSKCHELPSKSEI